MDTVETAVEYLDFHKTPFWKIVQGSNKVGESEGSDEMQDAIDRFRKSMEMLPAGSYTLFARKKENDTRGELKFPFKKGQQIANTPAMNTAPVASTNAYGIADHIVKQIQEEARRTLLFEQMSNQFGPLVDLVKDIDKRSKENEKRLDKIEKYLKDDEDGDGIPDFLDMTKKASETVEAAGKVKSLFDSSTLFGNG